MTCADAEILISDYLDGTLAADVRAELERHLAACSECAALARDAGAAVAFMERAAEVEPPPELVTRILYAQPWKTSQGRGAGIRQWFRRIVQPVLQPRFAMGMALTVLSLAVLAPFVAPARKLKPEDFNPVRVWQSLDDRIYRGWQRTVKYYESIKFVYQIRSRLQEWNQQQQDEEQAPAADQGRQKQGVDERRLPVRTPPPAQPAVPPNSNRGTP